MKVLEKANAISLEKPNIFLSGRLSLIKNHKLYRSIKTVCSIIILLLANTVFGQPQVFRRHFIVAYDVSTPFINARTNCPAYTNALVDLFLNWNVLGFNEAYRDNLIVEKNNGVPFFDANRDEITFFHFNIAASEFSRLRESVNYGEKRTVTEFVNAFLKNKKMSWSAFSKQKNGNIRNYWRNAFSRPPVPAVFGRGVSMSNFVYPLVMEKLDAGKYAEEYILVILSDFLTGSLLGNTKDLERVRDIFTVPYSTPLSPDSPVSWIKKEIDYLASQYYRIEFFQYSFAASPMIGILGYKIKPKIGTLTPEDVALFVDGDLDLNQRGYRSDKFTTSKTKIKFTHNVNLTVTELRMNIALPENDTLLFGDVVASKNEAGEWISAYTSDKNLMNWDSVNHTYYIPAFKIALDSMAINGRNFESLKFTYQFGTTYRAANTQPVNFIYKTERALPIENISFSTKTTIIIMYYVLPLIAGLILIFILAGYGKPRKLLFRIESYLDSFERTNYQIDGKLVTPYKPWNCEKQKGIDYIPVTGMMVFKSPEYLFNWNSPVYLRLTVENVPAGFELFLKYSINDIREFSAGFDISIKKKKKGKLEFVLGIRQTDINRQFDNPESVKFSVEAVVKDSLAGIKSEIRELVKHQFHIGDDLQDVWVAFDPGTTGSCVAVGSATGNIILVEENLENEHNKIIPSVIVCDKKENYNKGDIDNYRYGTKATAVQGNINRYTSFKSIKKLLGYKDDMSIDFENGNKLTLKGKDISALLVKGLYKETETFINKGDFKIDDYMRGEKGLERFNPLRAVVAIPNNFTASKIRDMIYCIAGLNQFKEIRYVYEAEAVLFYYLSNYSKFNSGKNTFGSETVLVFDMGGATINATIVKTSKTYIDGHLKYDIDILGKIGYGIGGDTIDYCIIKFILSFAKEYPQLKEVDMFDQKQKIELTNMALNIKKEIIRNYYETANNYLITVNSLESDIRKALGISLTIEEDSNMYKHFMESGKGKYGLFGHKLFVKQIYKNIQDAVHEVLALSENIPVDRIIFSGRSTAFPLVKETVEQELKPNNESIAFELEELKTAVAQGACWYGINKSSVRLNNLKTNASFGFTKTLSADRQDVKYHELIEAGHSYSMVNNSRVAQGTETISDDFAFDGNKVNFYQVMGKDADKILSQNQKHKFSKVATVSLDQTTSQIGMQVGENDTVDCIVKLRTNRRLEEKGMVVDQDITDANEEHYTWSVK
jgi:molecular chaperone DnaK (HSP70)